MFKNTKFVAIAVLIVFAYLFAGCSEDNNSAPLNELNGLTEADFIAASEDFTEALVDEEEGMLHIWEEAQPGHGEDVEWFGRGGFHILPDTSVHHRFDHTVTIIRTFYDAEGNPYEEYDSLTTVSMDRVLMIEGERGPRLGRTSSFTHWDSMRVDGIAPDDEIRTLNGIGNRNVESEWVSRNGEASRSFSGSYSWTVENLTHNLDRETYPYPLSGEIDVAIERIHEGSGRGGERSHSVSFAFTVIFDGTQYAQILKDDETSFWVDLLTRIRYDERPED